MATILGIFPLLLGVVVVTTVIKTPEGVVVVFIFLHGLLTNKNIRIPINNKKVGDPPYPPHYHIFGGTRGVNSKIVVGFQNFAWAPN